MTSSDVTMVVTGARSSVTRAAPEMRRQAFPTVADPVDVWVMSGGMHMAALHGRDGYAFVLAYLDPQLRRTCHDLGIDLSLIVDVWHFQPLNGVHDDAMAREVMRNVARTAADGILEVAPIKPESRIVWQVAVESVTAVVTGVPIRTS